MKIAAVILAAGRSARFEGANKLLLPLGGRPLVTWVAATALAAGAAPVVAVTGHEADAVEEALRPFPVRCVRAPPDQPVLSASVGSGVAALPEDVAGAVLCLGDMAAVEEDHLRRLMAAAAENAGSDDPGAACVPTYLGRRGNPVLWPRQHFSGLMALSGDRGGQALLDRVTVREVAMADDGVLRDVDSRDDWEALVAQWRRAFPSWDRPVS